MMHYARSIGAGLLLVFALGVFGAASAQESCGDVNASGDITAADALAVLRKAVGQATDFQCPVEGALTRTGQSMCWDNDGLEINCNGTGQDGELRTGIPQSFTDNGDGTITDNVTGLMWEKLSRNDTIHDERNEYVWNEAFGKVGALNDAEFGGYDDWRLPNQRELLSLVTFGGAADTTIAGVFRNDCVNGCSLVHCSCTAAAPYWSSTNDPFDGARAMVADFALASSLSADKDTDRRVRAVRSVR